jgi:PAS domain S-box-containing protein
MPNDKSPPAGSPVARSQKDHLDRLLDEGLKETFPASDPVSINIDSGGSARPLVDLSGVIATALLSTRSDAIIAADQEGTIRHWNPGAERIFGFSNAEAIGQSLDIIIPERLRQRHWDGYDRAMKAGRSRYGEGDVLAVPATRKDGFQISVEFTIVLLRDGTGALLGIGAILRDVTRRFEELRELKRQLANRTG